jgi:hypothetical protein
VATAKEHRIELVRGTLDESRGADVLAFWSEHGVLSEAKAAQRLGEVVCVLRDSAGVVVGVNSAYESRIPLFGDRRLWIYRMLLPGEAADSYMPMLAAAHGALESEFDPEGDDPLGLCLFVADAEVMRRHPEAIWPDGGMIHAGYLPDGRQIRIGYFEGARV